LAKELFEQAAALRSECVVAITGKVRQRPAGTNNPKIPTGEVELMASVLQVLNMAEVLPFPVDDPEVASKVNEELRLKYRYLDLRRPEMARNLRLRSKVAIATRVFMEEQGFLEVAVHDRGQQDVEPEDQHLTQPGADPMTTVNEAADILTGTYGKLTITYRRLTQTWTVTVYNGTLRIDELCQAFDNKGAEIKHAKCPDEF